MHTLQQGDVRVLWGGSEATRLDLLLRGQRDMPMGRGCPQATPPGSPSALGGWQHSLPPVEFIPVSDTVSCGFITVHAPSAAEL